MLEAFSSTTAKQEYEKLNSQIKSQLNEVYLKISNRQQLERRVTDFIATELGFRRTPFEVRNYKKLIQSLQKTGLISQAQIDHLVRKANKLLSSQ